MTVRLCYLAVEHWDEMDGYVAAHGGKDPLRLPLRRFLSLVRWYFTRNAEESDIQKFDAQLWRPPRGQEAEIDPRSPWSPENEMASFAALKAGTGGSNVSAPPEPPR